jgi:chromosome partitioning protein
MAVTYGVGTRKGGQGKSTTVSTLARLLAHYGARVLVVDLAQPGTATASLRDIWPDRDHGELSTVLLSFQSLGEGARPTAAQARAALDAAGLPVMLPSQPSWSGGQVSVLPWDELLGEAAAFLHSERILAGMISDLAGGHDLVLIDYPAESGTLLANALVASDKVLLPLAPETPALEGADAMVRLMARTRAAGHHVELAGILLTRCDPKNKRVYDIVQTILQTGEVEGVPLSGRLLPFAIRANEFFEQSFRFGEPIWERTSNPTHWAGYVLLAEWILRDARLSHLVAARRGPALLPPETRILDVKALLLDDPEVRLSDFEAAHNLAQEV